MAYAFIVRDAISGLQVVSQRFGTKPMSYEDARLLCDSIKGYYVNTDYYIEEVFCKCAAAYLNSKLHTAECPLAN